MNEPPNALVETTANVALTLLGAALLLSFARLVRGPTLPDRVVALELMTAIAVGFISVSSIMTGNAVLMDAATVLALITFLATVAFARYVERGAIEWRQQRRQP